MASTDLQSFSDVTVDRRPTSPRARSRRRSRGKRHGFVRRVSLHLVLASYCLTSAAAFTWCVMVSLKSNPEFFSSSPWSLPKHVRAGNYVNAWKDAQIGRYFLNSVYVTSVSVGIGLVVSLMAAYVLARVEFRGRGLMRLFFLVGLMIPALLVIIPLYSLLRELHLLGSLTGLVIVYIATQIPFNVFVFTSFFATLPKELEEAAYVDGASPLRTFASIVVPQTGPAIASVALLNTISIWNEFFYALVFLTDDNRKTIPVGIFGLSLNAQYSADWVHLFAGLVITMIPMLLIFAFAQDRIAKGLSSGLKG